jgi:hypothetical protein
MAQNARPPELEGSVKHVAQDDGHGILIAARHPISHRLPAGRHDPARQGSQRGDRRWREQRVSGTVATACLDRWARRHSPGAQRGWTAHLDSAEANRLLAALTQSYVRSRDVRDLSFVPDNFVFRARRRRSHHDRLRWATDSRYGHQSCCLVVGTIRRLRSRQRPTPTGIAGLVNTVVT